MQKRLQVLSFVATLLAIYAISGYVWLPCANAQQTCAQQGALKVLCVKHKPQMHEKKLKEMMNKSLQRQLTTNRIHLTFDACGGAISTALQDNQFGWIDIYYWWPQYPTKTPLRIAKLSDLEGHIRINTATQALDFVRLFTSPRTYTARTPFEVELVRKDWVRDFKMDMGYSIWLRVLAETGSEYGGAEGVVGDRTALKLNLRRPLVRVDKDGFLIRRTLALKDVNYTSRHGLVTRVIMSEVMERVGREGAYRMVSRKTLKDNVAEDISIPGSE